MLCSQKMCIWMRVADFSVWNRPTRERGSSTAELLLRKTLLSNPLPSLRFFCSFISSFSITLNHSLAIYLYHYILIFPMPLNFLIRICPFVPGRQCERCPREIHLLETIWVDRRTNKWLSGRGERERGQVHWSARHIRVPLFHSVLDSLCSTSLLRKSDLIGPTSSIFFWFLDLKPSRWIVSNSFASITQMKNFSNNSIWCSKCNFLWFVNFDFLFLKNPGFHLF